MTPNDFDEYLKRAKERGVGAFIITVPEQFTLQVTFQVEMPAFPSTDATPGGWKGPNHLDNPDSLDPAVLRGREYPEERLP